MMKKVSLIELLFAYLIRTTISIVLFFIVKKIGLLDTNTTGLFAGTVVISMSLNIPSIFGYVANLAYAKIKKYNGTYSITAALVDYFVNGGLFTIFGFIGAVIEIMRSPEGGTIGGLAMIILPGALMMMALPFSAVLFIILLLIGKPVDD